MSDMVHSDAVGVSVPAEREATTVLDLIGRLESGERSNALDVLVEIALFEPCAVYSAAVSNNAGTKVIYSKRGGGFETCTAREWVREPLKSKALAELKALAATSAKPGAAQ